MVKEKTLITVKTLSKKMAEQIRLVAIDWNQDSLYMRIRIDLLMQKITPLGWKYHGSDGCQVWLVKMGPTYHWWLPPTDSTLHELYAPTLEQLFLV